jgi:S-adenosylmethionine-diacylgycerolhomoserine-N-methlytransferase
VTHSLVAEARTLLTMLRGQPRAGSHAERLQAFYAPQAAHYDRFREQLLHGRDDLLRRLPLEPGDALIELGGGTGRNIEFLAERVQALGRVEVVDLCPALLAQARQRCAPWPNVHVIEADVTHYRPAQPADVVLLSYALTMIPDWRTAAHNAYAMLRPGGTLAIVDFCLGETQPRWLGGFWRRWFAHDGVHLSREHAAVLRALFPEHEYAERRAPVPYLPLLRVPYYLFLGVKRR